MANSYVKAPVLSDLIKFEQPDFLGREKAKFTTSVALVPGTIVQGGPSAAIPWDLNDAEDIYGILVDYVPASSTAYEAPVLFAGPATINPGKLVWASTAVAADKTAGLAQLKKFNFIFERLPVTDALYPNQFNRVPD
jgi:hypothetical protein